MNIFLKPKVYEKSIKFMNDPGMTSQSETWFIKTEINEFLHIYDSVLLLLIKGLLMTWLPMN